jgi:hypothetical protein
MSPEVQKSDVVCSAPVGAKPRLAIERIPSGQSNRNLRFALLHEDWRRLSRRVVSEAKGVSQTCGTHAAKLECHESWSFDDRRKIQSLAGLLAICRLCHLATHIGQADWLGVEYDEPEEHLARVNGWTRRVTRSKIKEALALQRKRSRLSYTVDLSYVRQFGLTPRPFYDSTFIDVANDSEIPSLARSVSKATRRENWVATYRISHACFDAGTVEPRTDSPEEIDLLISSFAHMRHEHGTLIGLYGKRTDEHRILGDLRAWLERRDQRNRQRHESQR